MPYIVKPGLPSPEQWMLLRQSVGWATFEPEVAKRSLAATQYCVCAYDADRLIGMGRVLGDGVVSYYIGNVIVLPERQNEGIGGAIIEQIMDYVERTAAPGAIASLFAIRGKEEFYARFGFEARPDERHGSGMSRYY